MVANGEAQDEAGTVVHSDLKLAVDLSYESFDQPQA